MIEMRQRNSDDETNSFYASFETNRREKLIEDCQGFARTISAATNGTMANSLLHSELNNMYCGLRDSLLGTCPRRDVETPRRNRDVILEQGECSNLKIST